MDAVQVNPLSEVSDEVLEKYNRNRQIIQELALRKWTKAGWFTEEAAEKNRWVHLKDERKQATLAMIMEQQLMFQRNHEDAMGRALVQDTTTSDEALPTKFVMPVVRRVYALVLDRDFGVVQPTPGPTAFVAWLDFLREQDNTNILSVEYNNFQIGELTNPNKAKLFITRTTIQVVKQLLNISWSLEAQEDLRAQYGLDAEQELLNAFSLELARNIFARHLKEITNQAQTGVSQGTMLVTPWNGPNPAHNIPAASGQTATDRARSIYNVIIDADTDHKKANRRPSNGIICGYGLAGLLEKAFTATQSLSPGDQNLSEIGITDYGTYQGRFRIWGTDFMPDDTGFLYLRNPDQLMAGHVYAPYVPIQVMPAIYADTDATTGNYINRDAYTRNIRERSAHIVTKPYAFQPLKGPSGNTF